MQRLRTIMSYTLAFLATPLVMATFIGLGHWSKSLVASTGIKIYPRISGGEIVKTVDHPGYQTELHRTVFDGLFWDDKTGFIQIDWIPSRTAPRNIDEEIDYNQDGQMDFRIQLDTQTLQAKLVGYNSHVLDLGTVCKLKKGYAVRINLQR